MTRAGRRTLPGMDENELNEKAQQAREQALDDLRRLLADPHGRRVAWRLLGLAGVFRISYLPGLDAATVAFREGERNTGLNLLNDLLAASPGGYAQMIQENQDDGR